MKKELAKTYAPQEIEERIYKSWEENGLFAPAEEGEPYTIVIPPPNVTGQLHLGHALDCTMQDILIRYKRMQGYSALWLPGTDHAGIATQVKVEEYLRENEGKTRHDLGREGFIARVWEWKEEYGTRIIDQFKKMGASCDWSRERFTMDEGCSKAVRELFCSLYEKGLIYRGFRIINWCPSCTTALSDAEVEHEERDGNLWHIRYPLADGSRSLVIATTRPETMLGDVAVAVNPTDERYAGMIGKQIALPMTERTIPIIADEHVDVDFGTGCVKITPAHDPNDFEIGQRHNLPQIVMMTGAGVVNENGGEFSGLERYAARKAIVARLEELGLLVEVKSHKHNVGTCERCSTVIEPMTSDQWFVKMKPLTPEAIAAVEKGDVKFEPARFEKIYFNWMNEIRDWCISRQIWWGHQIPAFHCNDCGEISVSRTDITTCPKCAAAVRQDPDVLDTWFSSALWPFSTFGWPEKTEELALRYPTSTLVTGYDIIFFWVVRMMVMGFECMGERPFDTIFLHGLVRDANGQKMSKSAGNGIDPLEVIAQNGADALRFALTWGNAPGADMRLSDERIEAGRNFNNKLWNASRFVLMNLSINDIALPLEQLNLEDKWILSQLNNTIEQVRDNLDKFELGLALSKLYDFTWDVFCDWYIELVKPRLFATNTDDNKVAQNVIAYVLCEILRLLHPFHPFITEEIFQTLGFVKSSIMVEQFPTPRDEFNFTDEEIAMSAIIETIRAIRNRRAEMNVPPSKRTALKILTIKPEIYSNTAMFFEKLAWASGVEVLSEYTPGTDEVSIVTSTATVYIPMAELVDLEKEHARLKGEKDKILREIAMVEGKLANEGFVAKAPSAVIDKEHEKLAKYRSMLDALETNLAKI